MREFDFGVLYLGYMLSGLVFVIVLACTKQQQTDLSTLIGQLAGEVCIEGDDIEACLTKCQEETNRRTLVWPNAEPSAEPATEGAGGS